MNEPDAIVVKGHNCDAELFWFLRAGNSNFILSMRDPRDSVASMLTRLGEQEQAWAADLIRSVSAIFTARQATRNLLFSYEDRFFERRETLDAIADFLGVKLPVETGTKIFQKFTRENITKFLETMESLPENRKNIDHAGRLSDRDTMFNRKHIGDARSGKWQEIVRPAFRDSVNRCFEGLCGKTRLTEGTIIRFPEGLFSPVLHNANPYEPQVEGRFIRLLRFCWLPRGVWRLTVRGSLPESHAEVEFEISQKGRSVSSLSVKKEDLQRIDVSFEFTQRNYDKALFLGCSRYDMGRLNPLRSNAIELEATFVKDL
jgi:hypothetical protein